ncbi:MAG: MFS transporter, partial [Chitinophagales bacterium]|nr:MFS transporter [Chitinophagales bacterium]
FSISFVGILIALVQVGLIKIAIRKFGEKGSVYIGLLLYTVGLSLFAFATQSWMMYAFLIPYCLGGISGPALQGIMSAQLPANQQGELQGAMTGLMSATSIVGPLLMTNTFAFFTSEKAPFYFPGAAFLLGALFMLGSVLFAMRSLKHYKPIKHHQNVVAKEEIIDQKTN